MDNLTNFVFKKLIPGVLIFMVVGRIISDFVHNPSILINDFGGTITLIIAVVVMYIIYCKNKGKRIGKPIWIFLFLGIITYIIYLSFVAWVFPYYTVHPILTICVFESVLALIAFLQFLGGLFQEALYLSNEKIEQLKEKSKNHRTGFKETYSIYKQALNRAFAKLLNLGWERDVDVTTSLTSKMLNSYWICFLIFCYIQKKNWTYILYGKNASGWVFTLFTLFLRLLVLIYLLNTFVTEAACFVFLSAVLLFWIPLIGLPMYLLKAVAGKARDNAIYCNYCGRTFSELLKIGNKGIPLFWICTGISKNGREINDCPPVKCEKGKNCKCDNSASTCVKTSTFYICEECAEKVDWKKQNKEQDEWRNSEKCREQQHEEKRKQDGERSQKKERSSEFKTELPKIPIFFDGKDVSSYTTLANQYVKKTTIGSSMALLRQEDESGEWLLLEVKKSLLSKQQYRLEKFGNIDSHAVWFFFILMPNELNRQRVISILTSIRDAAIASSMLGCTIFLGLDKNVMSAYSSEIERLQQAGFGHGERLRKEICTLILDKAKLLDEFHDVFKTVKVHPVNGALKNALEKELELLQARFKEMEYEQSRN